MLIPFRPDGVTIDCGQLARIGLAELTRDVAKFRAETGIAPCLALVAGPAPDLEAQARRWLALKERALEPCGLKIRPVMIDPGLPPGSTTEAVRALVVDPSVHGVFLQYPFVRSTEVEAGRTLIPSVMDVDGANFAPEGWRPGQPVPATAVAAVRLILELAPEGSIVVLEGPSPVGPAVRALLRSAGREVTGVVAEGDPGVGRAHQGDGDGRAPRPATVVVAASGRPGSLNATDIPDGAVVIDAGYYLPGGDGEIRLSKAEPGRWRAFVPPRDGLGPLTVLELGRSTLASARGMTLK